MNFDQLGWWLILLLNLFGFYILRFSYITHGACPHVSRRLGLILLTISFVVMFIFYGFINMIALFIILWIVVTPVVMILINLTERKLYPYTLGKLRQDAEKMNISPDELRSYNEMSTLEVWEKIKHSNKQTKDAIPTSEEYHKMMIENLKQNLAKKTRASASKSSEKRQDWFLDNLKRNLALKSKDKLILSTTERVEEIAINLDKNLKKIS